MPLFLHQLQADFLFDFGFYCKESVAFTINREIFDTNSRASCQAVTKKVRLAYQGTVENHRGQEDFYSGYHVIVTDRFRTEQLSSTMSELQNKPVLDQSAVHRMYWLAWSSWLATKTKQRHLNVVGS